MRFAQPLQAQQNIHWFMIGELVRAKKAQGVKTISLASGNPDMPTPPAIVEAMGKALQNPTYHG